MGGRIQSVECGSGETLSSGSQGLYQLTCLEVWGGNRRVVQPIELPGLAAWVYSNPLAGQDGGGDLHYLSVCGQGRLTRIGLADVSGHGQEVSQVATCLRDLMRKHINTLDQSELLHDLNQSFPQQCLREVKFASIIFLSVYGEPGWPETGRLVFSNAGHPPPLWYRAREKNWERLVETTPHRETEVADLPLGVIPGTDYHQVVVRLEPGDLVVLYSDGLSEARNPQGGLLGEEGLLERARRLPVDSPAAAGEALVAAVGEFRQGVPVRDDETLVVLQRLPAER